MSQPDEEAAARKAIRRWMATVSLCLCLVIVVSFLACLFNDAMAGRVEKVWPVFTVIFPALVAQIMHYVQVGSTENKMTAAINAEKGNG